MRYLDVEYVARDSWIDPSTRPVQHVQEPPSVYFIPFSSPTSPLSMVLAHSTHRFFTPPVDFPPRDELTGSASYVQISMDGDYRRVACNIFKSSQTFISSLSVGPSPLFPYYWPISHPWICSPIRRFFSTSTSNRIDE